MTLLSDLKKGKRGAVAKAISIIENEPKEARKLLKSVFARSGNSHIIGITGPAGAGKSSLINKTLLELKKHKLKPAVLAVDPTSHVTGGAILGDRVRMTESADSGVYIRSIASRGATGAVSRSIRNSIRILEYAGFDPIIIESVGAGQTEIEISNIADITVVVFNPHTGDSIQTLKAGLTEIGDIYLVNKADLDGASQLYDAVRDYIGGMDGPIILQTSTKRNRGVADFTRHLISLMKSIQPEGRQRRRLESELRDNILNNVTTKVGSMLDNDKAYATYVEKLLSKKTDPYDAAEKMTRRFIK